MTRDEEKANTVTYQVPINCICKSNGCQNTSQNYFNRHTAICDTCYSFMNELLNTTPFKHHLCPCCHQPNKGEPLSLYRTCLDDVYQDGWTESGRGAWHHDPLRGKIVCISLKFD